MLHSNGQGVADILQSWQRVRRALAQGAGIAIPGPLGQCPAGPGDWESFILISLFTTKALLNGKNDKETKPLKKQKVILANWLKIHETRMANRRRAAKPNKWGKRVLENVAKENQEAA